MASLESRLSLVYEFNNSSPLFARVAAIELEKGNSEKAENILQQGLKLFPDYAAGYIIFGKLLTHLTRYKEAEESFRKGCSIIASKSSLEYYLNYLESAKKETSSLQGSRRVSFVDNKTLDIIDIDTPIEEQLDTLAKKIDNAKIPYPDNNEIIDSPDDDELNIGATEKIVSETIAEIYFAQGNLDEALTVYKKLMIKKPERSDFFEQKIKEIQSLINKRN